MNVYIDIKITLNSLLRKKNIYKYNKIHKNNKIKYIDISITYLIIYHESHTQIA